MTGARACLWRPPLLAAVLLSMVAWGERSHARGWLTRPRGLGSQTPAWATHTGNQGCHPACSFSGGEHPAGRGGQYQSGGGGGEVRGGAAGGMCSARAGLPEAVDGAGRKSFVQWRRVAYPSSPSLLGGAPTLKTQLAAPTAATHPRRPRAARQANRPSWGCPSRGARLLCV